MRCLVKRWLPQNLKQGSYSYSIRKAIVWIAFPVLLFESAVAVASTTSECLNSVREQAVSICSDVIKNSTADRGVYLVLGKALDTLRRHEDAVTHYSAAIERFPSDEALQRKLSAAKSNLKEQYWIKGYTSDSPPGSAPDKQATSFSSKLDGIRCRRVKGQVGLEACSRAISAKPNDARLHISKGNIYVELDQLEKAIGAYQGALTADPNNSVAQKRIEDIQLLLGAAVQEENIEPSKPELIVKKPKSANQANNGSPTEIVATSMSSDFLQKLQLLTDLRSQNLISEREFASRKQLLLDSQFQVASSRGGDQQAIADQKQKNEAFSKIDFGRYFALIIGNNQYKNLPKLETAVNDARSLAKLLKKEYGFEVRLLTNATRYDVLKALGEFRRDLGKRDNLLIYYAGHGVLDKASERGYWLPVDSEKTLTANWISTADITDTLKALQPWHVMVIADSCYSGSLARAGGIALSAGEREASVVKRLQGKKSRTVLTSGGLEPVTDSGGDEHSVFAQALLDVLEENDTIIEGQRLFTKLRNLVVLNADQTPEYSDVRKAGHNGGDFIFVRQ